MSLSLRGHVEFGAVGRPGAGATSTESLESPVTSSQILAAACTLIFMQILAKGATLCCRGATRHQKTMFIESVRTMTFTIVSLLPTLGEDPPSRSASKVIFGLASIGVIFCRTLDHAVAVGNDEGSLKMLYAGFLAGGPAGFVYLFFLHFIQNWISPSFPSKSVDYYPKSSLFFYS